MNARGSHSLLYLECSVREWTSLKGLEGLGGVTLLEEVSLEGGLLRCQKPMPGSASVSATPHWPLDQAVALSYCSSAMRTTILPAMMMMD